MVSNSHLQENFNQIPKEVGDIESNQTGFSASIVTVAVVALESLVPVLLATLEPGGGHQK